MRKKVEVTKITYPCRMCRKDVKIIYCDMKTGIVLCEHCNLLVEDKQ